MENMNGDEDNEINQVEHGRAKRVDHSLALIDQLIKQELVWYVRNLVEDQCFV